jgi:hypothetical protein
MEKIMLDLSRELLYQKYVVEEKSKHQVAKEVGCCTQTLSRKLKFYDIPDHGVKIEDLSGKKFGRLTLIRFFKRNRYSKQVWLCLCDCGNETTVDLASLKRGLTISCGCYKHEKSWKGYGEISAGYWNKLVKTASERGYDFTITIEQAWNIFLQQNRKCAISGLPLTLTSYYAHKYDLQSASPDRINSDYGYIPDNFQWVHKSINRIKGVLNNAELIAYCKVIYEYNKDYADALDINIGEINAWRKKGLSLTKE